MTSATPTDRPFRPRRARVVGLAFAVGIAVVMVGMSIGLSLAPESGWTGQDTVSALVFGAIVSGGLVRLVTVNAG